MSWMTRSLRHRQLRTGGFTSELEARCIVLANKQPTSADYADYTDSQIDLEKILSGRDLAARARCRRTCEQPHWRRQQVPGNRSAKRREVLRFADSDRQAP